MIQREWPGVSYVMPVLNEAQYLEGAVRAVLAQEYPGAHELVLALGPSKDGTTEIAERLAAQDARVRLVDNPAIDIPAGLNTAIAAAQHEIIVRVDAHSELTPGYTRRAVETLERTQAVNVGGFMQAIGAGGFQRAVAHAYNSPIGLGGGAYHSGAAEGPAESAYLGVFRRPAVRAVGGYDESLRRGEDWELNLRLREAGGTVWFDPELSVAYWPRETWTKLHRQFRSTGVWRGELVRRYGGKNSLRYFAPPLLVVADILTLVLAIVTAILGALGSPAAFVLGVLTGVVALVPLAHLVVILIATVTARLDGAARARYPLVLATMHIAWGLGFIQGFVAGGGNNRDTSRTEHPTEELPIVEG